MTVANDTSQATDVVPPRATGARRRGYLPEWRVWGVIAFCLCSIALVRWLTDDPSAFHIVTLIGSLVSGLSLATWFLHFSAYPLPARRVASLTIVLTLVALVACVRVERFSGSLLPRFALRWSQKPDERLQQPNPLIRPVDLTRSTPADFPQFLGPHRTGVVAGRNLACDWSQDPPRLLWRTPIGAGWSGFSAVNGYAVTMEQRGPNELVTCYDVASGRVLWSSAIAARHMTRLGYVGPRSTPLVDSGRVYAYGATGVLRCLDGQTGDVLWVRNFYDELGISQDEAEQLVAWGRANSPLIYEGRLIIPIGGGHARRITLAALDPQTGATLWEAGHYQISYASPVVARLGGVPQILSVNEDIVTAHDVHTGEILWSHDWEGKSNLSANVSQPLAVGEDRVLLTKGYGRGGKMLAIHQDGSGKWTAEPLWHNPKTLKTKFSNVVIRDGYAYALDDGILCCADLETGERQWKQGRYRYGQLLMVDDLILVMSEEGRLALVEANPHEFRELGSIQALEGQSWNTLCLYGRYLLVRNAEEAACYELAGREPGDGDAPRL